MDGVMGGEHVALVERWQGLWGSIRASEPRIPVRVTIPVDHVEWGANEALEEFQQDQHYFLVRVNEVYLTYGRQWFEAYDPMVLVVSEFIYDTQEQAVPFVVGPSLLESRGHEVPNGMIFSDTRVAGLHPYRGGRLCLSVVLSRVGRENYATKYLRILESAVGAIDFATALSSYVKVAGVVLEGVQTLFELGDGTKPLIGYRREFDPDGGDTLAPAYFALIDAPDIDLDRLWVRDHQLHIGDSLEQSQPFRDADFVLYSILQAGSRGDERTLPFYPLVQRMQQVATSPDEADRTRAKADMASLWQTLVLSPDLTTPQRKALATQYRASLKELLEEAREGETLGGTSGPGDPATIELRQAADILDM